MQHLVKLLQSLRLSFQFADIKLRSVTISIDKLWLPPLAAIRAFRQSLQPPLYVQPVLIQQAGCCTNGSCNFERSVASDSSAVRC